jgi:hypothetical protein
VQQQTNHIMMTGNGKLTKARFFEITSKEIPILSVLHLTFFLNSFAV